MNDLTLTARRVFADDRYATKLTGVTIDHVCPNEARCSLVLSDMHRNARGSVMGGVYFTLADFAFAIAVNSSALSPLSESDMPMLTWVSSSASVHFLTAAKGDNLTAVAKCIRQGRSSAVYQTSITDSEGRLVAIVTTNGINTSHS